MPNVHTIWLSGFGFSVLSDPDHDDAVACVRLLYSLSFLSDDASIVLSAVVVAVRLLCAAILLSALLLFLVVVLPVYVLLWVLQSALCSFWSPFWRTSSVLRGFHYVFLVSFLAGWWRFSILYCICLGHISSESKVFNSFLAWYLRDVILMGGRFLWSAQ